MLGADAGAKVGWSREDSETASLLPEKGECSKRTLTLQLYLQNLILAMLRQRGNAGRSWLPSSLKLYHSLHLRPRLTKGIMIDL
jgi:hypothetical protein